MREAELPALAEQYELDEKGRQSLDEYVLQLQNWLAGILNWHRGCDRYTEPGLLRRYGTGPRRLIGSVTGIGTDAARISLPPALMNAISHSGIGGAGNLPASLGGLTLDF